MTMPHAAASDPSIVKCMTCSRVMQRLARAQAAHHGAAVEMALEITPGGERDRRRREQHAGERGQIEEALGALERGADLRPRVAYALDALARRRAAARAQARYASTAAASPAICRL